MSSDTKERLREKIHDLRVKANRVGEGAERKKLLARADALYEALLAILTKEMRQGR